MSEAIDRLDAVFAHNIHFSNGSWPSKLALGNKSEYFSRQKQNKNQFQKNNTFVNIFLSHFTMIKISQNAGESIEDR